MHDVNCMGGLRGWERECWLVLGEGGPPQTGQRQEEAKKLTGPELHGAAFWAFYCHVGLVMATDEEADATEELTGHTYRSQRREHTMLWRAIQESTGINQEAEEIRGRCGPEPLL